ncbi:carbohydrate ABC transporter permease [Leifsonia sp. Root112D2]|uniref:carbohydrate ABC transporter permease n=1 Tax=Leifsonia sp. Root112D2 TaxID=1736426 RepID=UPI0006F3851B|nr:carbohydrate ABC transporter permease [Leifsonia sp. Root112D2]KQV06504.1 transporter [Leifsonia sp. Root112D2]
MTVIVERPRAAAERQGPRVKKRKDHIGRALILVPAALLLLFTLIPFYWLFLFAFRANGSTSLLPIPFTLDHFATVWNGSGFGIYFVNSVYVAIAALFITSVLSVLGGYALARFAFRGKTVLLIVLLCTQFVPGAMMLIPLFQVLNTLNLINSLWGLIIVVSVFQLPLSLILMAGFIRNVPIELEEAAWIDGCSRIRGFCAVVLPLLRPAIVAIGSFAFIEAWNVFLFALMFLNDQSLFTVPVGLSYLIGEYGVDFGALAAGGVIAIVPVVILFAYVQKFLVQGLSAGAVKG